MSRAHGSESAQGFSNIANFCDEDFLSKSAANMVLGYFFMQDDSCGVRTHALADWRLEPAP